MASESSLDSSMSGATKHYSSMFFLPSYKKSLLGTALILIGGVGLCGLAFFSSIVSLVLAISLFALTLLADVIISKEILKGDPIFSVRRISAMSYFGWLVWLAFVALGVGLSYLLGSWLLWVKLCLLGFTAVVTLRVMVFSATSTAAKWKQVVSSLLQPIFCVVGFIVFWFDLSSAVALPASLFILVSPIIGYVAVFIFLLSLDRLGKRLYSLPALPLFKAFILNWVTGENVPLEMHLEEMGENVDIDVSLLKFDSSKPKAAVIVPLVHPGPFKNIGSSLLPSLLKKKFEEEFGCDTCTPLGILGHELDLASQTQNSKIVSDVIAQARFKATNDLASPFVKVSEGYGTASCQIFGDTALVSLTLAPKTTEDLPQEVGQFVSRQTEKHGIKHAVVINAHNCLDDVVTTEEFMEELQSAVSKCLQKAIMSPTEPFMVGASTIFPEEFSLKQGMGTGGITAVVVQVRQQKAVYIVIDGNNMVQGLREEIISSLSSLGFDESEIFTTDTHAVSAIVTGRRGYHPVGEVMDHEVLLHYIGEVAKKAEANLEACRAGCVRFVVPQVRVIGEERLRSITMLVDKAIEKAKQIVLPIFGLEGLLLILILALL
jgi:putative membrane protein